MASPNLLSANLILGKTDGVMLSTSDTSVLTNASGSGKTFKVNTLNLSNQSAATATASIKFYSAAALGGTGYAVAANLSVPPTSTLTLIDKGTQYYVEENKSIGGTASATNSIIVTISYEDIS
jgi:hypothetical protein